MNPSKAFYACVILTGLCLALSGCPSASRYSYEKVRQEYAATLEQLPAEQAPAVAIEAPAIDQPLALADAIDIALANNLDEQMAIARIKRAEAELDRAKAPFWPQASFYTEYMQGDAPSAYLFKTIDQRRLPPNVNFNDPGWFENYESGLTASLNLYNGGRDYLTKAQAANRVDISRLDRQVVENALVAAVIHAYYDIRAAQEAVRIADESVATVNEELRVTQVRYEGGSALKSDVLSLDVRLARAREMAVGSRNRQQTATAAFAELLGASPDTNVRLADEKPDPVDYPQAYEAGLIRALKQRPELAKARMRVVQGRIALDKARTGYLPRLDVLARWYVDDPNMSYDLERDNWTAAVLLNWEFFSGFSTSADKSKAAAMLEEMIAADRQAVQKVKLDVKTAYLRLDEAEARLQVAQSSIASATESFKLVKKQYEGGSATITRYLEAEFDRNRALLRASSAFYDRQKASADVARAVGRWGLPITEADVAP
jgi:outer membrane protein TolC